MWHKTSLQLAFKLHHVTLLLHIKHSLICYREVTPTKKENIEDCVISDRCHAQSKNLHLHQASFVMLKVVSKKKQCHTCKTSFASIEALLLWQGEGVLVQTSSPCLAFK